MPVFVLRRSAVSVLLAVAVLLGGLASASPAYADHTLVVEPDGCSTPLWWGEDGQFTRDVKQYRVSKDRETIKVVCRFTSVPLTYQQRGTEHEVPTGPRSRECEGVDGRYLGGGTFNLTPSGNAILRCTLNRVGS